MHVLELVYTLTIIKITIATFIVQGLKEFKTSFKVANSLELKVYKQRKWCEVGGWNISGVEWCVWLER